MGDKSESITVGYKYFLGAHMGLVHGPVDGLQRIRVADKCVWAGVVESGRICIDAEEIFGGEGAEGGVKGEVVFANGEPTQIPSVYLQGNLGTPLPAFRGITCAILEQPYISANNPYLKPWSFMLTRTDITTRGTEQWYAAKAAIATLRPTFTESDESCENATEETSNNSCPSSGMKEDPPGFCYYDVGETECGDTIEGTFYIRGRGRYYPPGQNFTSGNAPWSVASVTSPVTGSGTYSGVVNLVCGTYADRDMAMAVQKADGSGTGNFNAANAIDERTTLVMSYDSSGLIFSNYFLVDDPEPEPVIGCDHLCVDMNPAHIIRECLTDKEWGMGYTDADIDDVAFTAAADTLYDEQMGISILWQRENTIEAFVQDIVRHIDAALYVDRRTGKFVLKLIRSEPTPTLTLGPNQIERVENYKRPAFGDLVNSVTVIYDDCDDGKLTGPAA